MAGTACSGRRSTCSLPVGVPMVVTRSEWIADQSWSNGDVGHAQLVLRGLKSAVHRGRAAATPEGDRPGHAGDRPWRDNGTWSALNSRASRTAGGSTSITLDSRPQSSATAEGDQRCLRQHAPRTDLGPDSCPGYLVHGSDQASSRRRVWSREEPLELRRSDRVPVMSMISWQDESTGSRRGYFEEKLDPETTMVGKPMVPTTCTRTIVGRTHMIGSSITTNGEDKPMRSPESSCGRRRRQGKQQPAQPGEVITDERSAGRS